MDIHLDTYSFHYASDVWEPHPGQPRDILWIAEQARELGFNGLHTADWAHFTSTITPQILKQNLGEMSLSLGTGGYQPEHMREVIEATHQIGQTVFRTFLGKDITEKTFADIQTILPLLEEYDIIMAIENHMDLTSGELVEIIKKLDNPNIGICLDLGNALGVMEDPRLACEALAQYTYTTHIKDYHLYPARMGYVFWSAIVGEGSCRVREQLEILFDKSPLGKALPLNLESALEFIDFSDRNAQSVLESVTRFSPQPPPSVHGLKPEDLLVREQELIQSSLTGLRQILADIGA